VVRLPQRRHRSGDLGRRVGQRIEALGQLIRGPDAVADCDKVARSAAADHKTRQRARQVGSGVEKLAGFLAGEGVIDENLDAVETAADGVGIGQRRCQPLRQEPRAGRRHGAVDRGQERAAPLARERARELQVRPRRLIDRQGRALRLAERRRQRRPFAELRAFDIGDAGGRRIQFQPRQRAECLGGGDSEIIR